MDCSIRYDHRTVLKVIAHCLGSHEGSRGNHAYVCDLRELTANFNNKLIMLEINSKGANKEKIAFLTLYNPDDFSSNNYKNLWIEKVMNNLDSRTRKAGVSLSYLSDLLEVTRRRVLRRSIHVLCGPRLHLRRASSLF